jgi:hypothetical protein
MSNDEQEAARLRRHLRLGCVGARNTVQLLRDAHLSGNPTHQGLTVHATALQYRKRRCG